MSRIDFVWSGPPLTERDFDDVERSIGRVIPSELKQLYLWHNGGRPRLRCFFDEKGGEHAIHEFLTMKHRGGKNARLLEDSFATLKQKSILPANALPIAVNEGGDFYFLDNTTGEVYFLAMDYVDQPSRARRHVAASVSEFLATMVSDEEMFG